MNIKLYNAAHGRMHSAALEVLARLEAQLNSVEPSDLNREIVDNIVEDAKQLAQLEGALLTMQQYFSPQPAAPPQEPMPVTPEISPTYKKSLKENE